MVSSFPPRVSQTVAPITKSVHLADTDLTTKADRTEALPALA